jgi:glycosyltransferase involved in cell wall biosynthesis
MRVLLVDQFGEMGGAQRCLVDVAEGFAECGWETHAVVPSGDLSRRLQAICGSVDRLPCGPFHSGRKTATDGVRFLTQLAAQKRLLGGLLSGGYFDICYVNGPRLMPAAAMAHGVTPVVFHCHSAVSQPVAAAILRRSIRAAQASVIASSQFVARPLQSAAPGRLRIVPNGVRSCAAPRGLLRLRPTVAVLGRIAPEKGQVEFVRACSMVRHSMDCRFVIAGAPLFGGGAYQGVVEREAREANVELSGWIDDIPSFLASVDLLVVPSAKCEATPRVIMEAFSAGTPVLAFAGGGVPEMIRHGDTGLLIYDRGVEALARAILRALRCPLELRRIAERGRQRWRDAYTVERFQNEIRQAVQEAFERSHHRNPLARAGVMAET